MVEEKGNVVVEEEGTAMAEVCRRTTQMRPIVMTTTTVEVAMDVKAAVKVEKEALGRA